MASISKSQGMWRVRIRHKEGPQISRVFVRKGDATRWAARTERALQLGLNVVEVAAISGHKDLKMLQRYTHLRAEDLARKLR